MSYTPKVSFEFFPPKDELGETALFETVAELVKHSPEFVSITYGAGGSTRDKTLKWTKALKNDYGLNTVMHFTCYGNTIESVNALLNELHQEKIASILALRGDPTNNPTDIKSKAFDNAEGLVRYLKTSAPSFEIGVAGYPEKHPESLNIAEDISFLKRKVDAGASYIITQLFFDNVHYFRFLENLQRARVDIPVYAGIMPASSYAQVMKFTKMCAVQVPAKLSKKLDGVSETEAVKYGIEFSIEQCRSLLEQGVCSLHFYTMNKHPNIKTILENL
ncbi:MAG: methylenetetrahydrofolate reductase [NAD(P)H] [Deferribacteraceae bacterium]|jgi:methylenetetrahydrofolate reductase (NADPH)|nr:methylenetetrahydrofolate reductase [NAD(P)H] [Deferribacteraceae bacterium]